MKVAVIGHSGLNIAPAVCADLALRGFDVAWWPAPAMVGERGGIEVRQGHLLDAARDGFAPIRACADAAAALTGAEAIIVDSPATQLLPLVAGFAKRIEPGALLHAQSHGYWPASRLAVAFAGHDIRFADSSAPTHAAAYSDGVVTAHARRHGLRFATTGAPQQFAQSSMALLGALYPGAAAAAGLLETGLESINLMIHPGATLANLGAFDRAAAVGSGFSFYGEGNTETATRLAETLDAERGAVCTAWGVRHQTLLETLGVLYGARGHTLREAIASCGFYAGLGALPARAPQGWAGTDLPYALVPLIRLAQARGVDVPLHRAAVAALSAAFNLDPWAAAPSLHDLGVTP